MCPPNVQIEATDAGLLRQVASNAGLGVAVPPAPTFGVRVTIEQAVNALPDRELLKVAIDCARMGWSKDYVTSRLTAAPEIYTTEGQPKEHGYGIKFHNGQDWCFVEAGPVDLATTNVQIEATDAGLLRQVASNAGLGVAVPPAPTFGVRVTIEQAVNALPDRELLKVAIDCARMGWSKDYVTSRLTAAPEIYTTEGQPKEHGYGIKFHNGQDWCFVEAGPVDLATTNVELTGSRAGLSPVSPATEGSEVERRVGPQGAP